MAASWWREPTIAPSWCSTSSRGGVLHNITGHEDDVNAVCFADKQSPHILYSGSERHYYQSVGDRRSLGDRREAGAFVGHCEGLTYIDSKGDGPLISCPTARISA